MVRVENVSKAYGSLPVLRDVSLEVKAGEVVVLIGGSGSGKTTLLRCINRLETIDAGRIWVNGVRIGATEVNGHERAETEAELNAKRSRIGMVFQRFNLFSHMTALQNVALAPVMVQKMNPTDADALARRLLQKVGLGEKLDAYPSRMSGGQQQRVGIARALALKPKVVLFDEPTSALDPELVGEVLSVIRDLAVEGWTMVIVTHEIQFARQVSDQVLFTDHGLILEKGPPDEVIGNPKEERTRQFLQRILNPL